MHFPVDVEGIRLPSGQQTEGALLGRVSRGQGLTEGPRLVGLGGYGSKAEPGLAARGPTVTRSEEGRPGTWSWG